VLQSKGGDRRHGEVCCDHRLLAILPLVLTHRAYSHDSICLVLESQAPSYKTVTPTLVTCRPVQNTGSPIRHLHKCQNILHLDNSGYGLPAPIAALTDTPFFASLSGHTKQPFHLFKRPQQFTQEIFALDAALTLTFPPDVVYSVCYSFTP